MSAELKQLFHSPDELSDQELDILRVKLQNMRRLPKFGAAFGVLGAACCESVILRRNPTVFMMGLGAVAGYAFSGYGTSSMTGSMLMRPFEYEILIEQEKRQQRRVLNLAGYGQDYITGANTELNKSYDKPY